MLSSSHKITPITVKGPKDEGPKTVKLVSNKEHMGFSNVNDLPTSDTIDLSPDNLKLALSFVDSWPGPTRITITEPVELGTMTQRCSHCNSNRHNLRMFPTRVGSSSSSLSLCGDGGVKLFGVSSFLQWILHRMISEVRIEMWPDLSPFGSVLANPFVFNGDLSEGFESPGVLFLVPILLFQGGAMDLSKVGEKILSFVMSATSLGLLPSASNRPEVPARAVAAAAVARAIAGPEVLRRVHGGRVRLYDGFHPRSSRE
ncbi:hypothetical protein EV1_007736 [Malus domestica]